MIFYFILPAFAQTSEVKQMDTPITIGSELNLQLAKKEAKLRNCYHERIHDLPKN
jgi:hypothetical protein